MRSNKNSFYETIKRYSEFDFAGFFSKVRNDDVVRALHSLNDKELSEIDFLTLLSEKASGYLEQIAHKAQEITERNFGKVIYLYAPLYLSNFCDNECAYCGFHRLNKIQRKKLTLAEVEKEANKIADTGIRHILILTGDSRKETPVSYIKECVVFLKKYFTSISAEVYALENEEYQHLIVVGVDGLTIYQETYDERLYKRLHGKGPKADYCYRLDAPERACQEKMRNVSVGALLGLSDFRREVFFAGLHAYYLQRNYPETEVSISLPRLQTQVTHFVSPQPVNDAEFVQAMVALRLFLPRAGITISTREKGEFRNNLIGLGVTRMSAGSKTGVGGYSLDDSTENQFDMGDTRTVREIMDMIYKKGYQPVLKDWQTI